MTATQTNALCSRCEASAQLLGIDCRKCHYTALVMLYVHKYWQRGELEGLRNEIRVQSLGELIRECPSEAVLMRKIYNMIRIFSHPSGMHEDALKSSVCDEISRYIGAMKGVDKYEAINGEGSYMRTWTNHVKTILK